MARSLSSDLGSLWATLAAEVKPLATTTYANLPSTGLLLDATPWAALPFAEGETLHFKPAALPAAPTPDMTFMPRGRAVALNGQALEGGPYAGPSAEWI